MVGEVEGDGESGKEGRKSQGIVLTGPTRWSRLALISGRCVVVERRAFSSGED
jgi:hypothetical protein